MMLLRLLILLLISSFVYADDIRQSEQDDGVIEFSNIENNSRFQTDNKITAETLIYKADYGDFIGFSDSKPESHVSYEVLRFDCFACDPTSTVDWQTIPLNTVSYRQFVNQYAFDYNVEPALIRALIHAESAFKADALSRSGAQGLMQLMPPTAKDLGVDNAFDPQQNIKGGVKYIAWLLTEFNQDISLATAAYNAGPNAVKKYNGIPPYQETQVYVERVGTLYKRYQTALK